MDRIFKSGLLFSLSTWTRPTFDHSEVKIGIYINKNIKMSSFKSSKNIEKKKGGPDRSVSDNQSSSVTLKNWQ